MDGIVKYIKVDLYRCFLSKRFVTAVVIILGVLLFGVQEAGQFFSGFDPDVYSYFVYTVEKASHLLIFSGAAFAYAGSFCEDREYRYIRNEVMRGSKKSFVAARVVTVFLSAQIAVTFGEAIFACILHFFHPWVLPNTTNVYETVVEAGVFHGLSKGGYHFLYFVMWGLCYGAFAGILSVVSTWISLYISNTVLMLISPVVVYYFLDILYSKFFPVNIHGINILFTINECWTQNTGMAVLVLLVIALSVMLLFGYLIYGRLKKEV